jgi:hypothetical protein
VGSLGRLPGPLPKFQKGSLFGWFDHCDMSSALMRCNSKVADNRGAYLISLLYFSIVDMVGILIGDIDVVILLKVFQVLPPYSLLFNTTLSFAAKV